MSSKSVLALAAIAALGTSCLVSTDASAFDQNQKKYPVFSRAPVQAPPRPVVQQVKTPAPVVTSHAPTTSTSTG